MIRIINSPIFIALLAIAALFIWQTRFESKLGGEIRSAYDELISIAEDASSDPEKTKAVRDFAEQVATQLSQGFVSGFSSGKSDKESSTAKFLRYREDIVVSGVQEIPSQFDTRQEFLFNIANGSESPVSSLRFNVDYYYDGELIDSENKWLSDVKVLDAGESVNQKLSRTRTKKDAEEGEEDEHISFDEVKITLTSFKIDD